MRLIDADEMRENLVWCKSQSSSYDDYWDDVIERLDAQPTVGGWVSVKDRLPNETEDVIICYEWVGFSGTKYREVTVNDLREVKQISDRIIAWMPLPEPPKEDDA